VTYTGVTVSPNLYCGNLAKTLPGGVTNAPQMSFSLDTGTQTCTQVLGAGFPYSVGLKATVSISIPSNITLAPGSQGFYTLSPPITTTVQATGTYTSTAMVPVPNEYIYFNPLTSSANGRQCGTPQQVIQPLNSSSGTLTYTYTCTQSLIGLTSTSAGIVGGFGSGVQVALYDSNYNNYVSAALTAEFNFTMTSGSTTPQISVSPNPLDFGNVGIGATANKTLTVSNKGTGPLTVSALQSSDIAVFNFTSPSTPFTVAANGSTPVTVQYTPTKYTDESGTLTIVSNDPSSPTVVELSGTVLCAGSPGPALGGSPMALPKDTLPPAAGRLDDAGGCGITLNSISPGVASNFSDNGTPNGDSSPYLEATITGTGFSKLPSNPRVCFGTIQSNGTLDPQSKIKAAVLSVTDTQIAVQLNGFQGLPEGPLDVVLIANTDCEAASSVLPLVTGKGLFYVSGLTTDNLIINQAVPISCNSTPCVAEHNTIVRARIYCNANAPNPKCGVGSPATAQLWVFPIGGPIPSKPFLPDNMALGHSYFLELTGSSPSQGSIFSFREGYDALNFPFVASSRNQLSAGTYDFYLTINPLNPSSPPFPGTSADPLNKAKNLVMELPAQPFVLSTTPLRVAVVIDQAIVNLRTRVNGTTVVGRSLINDILARGFDVVKAVFPVSASQVNVDYRDEQVITWIATPNVSPDDNKALAPNFDRMTTILSILNTGRAPNERYTHLFFFTIPPGFNSAGASNCGPSSGSDGYDCTSPLAIIGWDSLNGDTRLSAVAHELGHQYLLGDTYVSPQQSTNNPVTPLCKTLNTNLFRGPETAGCPSETGNFDTLISNGLGTDDSRGTTDKHFLQYRVAYFSPADYSSSDSSDYQSLTKRDMMGNAPRSIRWTDQCSWNWLYAKFMPPVSWPGATPCIAGAGRKERGTSASSRDTIRAEIAHASASTPMIFVSGLIGQDNMVTFSPCHVTTSALPAGDPSSPYSVSVLNASGQVLASAPINVSFFLGHVQEAMDTTDFAATLPFPAGAAMITVNNNNTPIGSLKVPPHSPSVQLISPNGGEHLDGTVAVSWAGSDPDGNPLTYTLLLSKDNGATWNPIVEDLTGSSYMWDTTSTGGTSQGRLQVIANDGVNDGTTTSAATFSIAFKGPVTAIAQPTDGSILTGPPFQFGGYGFDLQDGSLADSALTFSSNRDGVLGKGGFVSVNQLSSGTHTITLTGTNSQGMTFSSSITIVYAPPGAPSIISINPSQAATGASVTLTGTNFGATAGQNTVLFGTVQAQISSASTAQIVATVPKSLASGDTPVAVVTGGVTSNSVDFTVTGSGSGGNNPQITTGGVVNAADYVAKVSRGSLAFAFGSNLASPPTAVAQSIPLPFSANGASVTVAGFPAPVYVVDPSFVEFQIPYEAPLGSVPVVVSLNGTPSNTVNVTVADYAVGPFQYNRTANIVDPDIFHLNGTLVTPASPAVPSETLIVIANGIGKLNNPPKTNAAVSAPYPTAVDTPVVTVGGVAAVSQYAGLLAGDLGVVQMNIQLPANLPSGTLPVVFQFPNDSSPPVGLYVMGNVASGAPQISVASLTFSGGTVGQSQTLPLVITNAGSAPLTITGISVNPSGGPFTINYPSLPFTLQPGGSTGSLILASVTVTFTPTSPGTASAVVIIASNDPNTPSKTVGLNGTATGANVPPSIAVTPSGLNFSSVAQGSSKQASVTVSNAGGTPLNISALTAGGVFSVVSPATPFTVGVGSSSTVILQFSPTGLGGQSSTLNIASNDPKQPNLSMPIWGTGYNPANVITSDSFNRGNATECALGTTDLRLGGSMNYQYLPIWPGSNPVGASIVSDALQNNGMNYGGVQLTSSSDVCGAVRGSTFPQDLDVIVDVYVPGTAGALTDAGPYFRSRAAAPGDGISGGTSSGYWVEVFSNGQVWVDQLNPFATIAQSPTPSSFDPSIVHTLEARIQGTSLQAWLDGQPVTFTLTSGGAGTTVPVSTAANAGTVGINFGSELNPQKAGGQSVRNLIISSLPAASAPQISVSPASLNLGSLTVGQSANVLLNISNTGTAALNVSAIASSSGVTIVSPAVPFTVQPGATTAVTMKFAPTAAGAVNGMLTINSNDPAHGQITVSFSGTGVAAAGTPVIGASVTSVAFGNVAVGQVSTISFNVLNTGTAALTVSSVAISNAVFGLMTPTIPLTAQPGSFTPVTVVFAPQSAGPQSATFTVTSNDPAHPVVAVTLTGTGTGAPNNLLAYSNVVVGQSETGTLTFTNTGTTPLMVTAQTTTNAAFTVPSPSTPYSIPAGQSAAIMIVFNPTAYTVYNATFSLVTNAGTFTTALSGAGVAVQ
jgi:uncharacterized protein (TIGR03437 family)